MRQWSFRILIVSAVFVVFFWAAPKGRSQSRNLVPNPGFEQGQNGKPAHWTFENPLTQSWQSGGVDGRFLRFDTDVYLCEVRKATAKPEAQAQKNPTSGNKHNTVAGTEGVRSWSEAIRVKPGQHYLLQVDAKGPEGTPFVYLKGFRKLEAKDAARHGSLRFFRRNPGGPAFSLLVGGTEKRQPVAGDYLQTYRARLVCHLPGDGKWRRFHRTLKLKTRKNYRAEVVLLMLYAYWPAGQYSFDNVVLRPISEEEAKHWDAKRTANGIPHNSELRAN